jgi:gamma-glutamylcyclotransferase (GGCT)/AIG2-like uncharacterized protein YtfP
MTDDYLFVYGTLRQESGKKISRVLACYADFIATATYQGKLYQINDYPGAVPSANANDVVHGEVYKLSCSDIILAQLDDYEECSHSFPEPTEYNRCQQTIKLETSEMISAWMYLFNRPIAGLQRIQSGDFYKKEALLPSLIRKNE